MKSSLKSCFVGILFFLAMPLTSYALDPIVKGIVQEISVGYSDPANPNSYTIYATIGNTRYFLLSTFESTQQQAVLSLLIYSKGSGTNVTLYNHPGTSTTIFDEARIESQ